MAKNGSAVKIGQTRAEWLEERKTYIGGSEAGKVVGVSRWGCPRSVAYEKLGIEKDFEEGEKAEFSRGNRLEGIASEFYQELTGREVRYTTRSHVRGKPHLAVSMDRLVFKKEDTKRENPGYLEIKVQGRFPFLKTKKEGIGDDWTVQVQYGCAVKGLSWGSYAIYCPELDELLHFDVVADKALGETLLEKVDDFWNFHIECQVLPDPLPDDSKPCQGCAWAVTCRGSVPIPANAGFVSRPDLEALVAKFAEVKGMGSEVSDAEDEIKAEILEKIKETPGTYRAGKYEFSFKIAEQKRFSGEDFKKSNPELYEKFRKSTVVKTLNRPKEV